MVGYLNALKHFFVTFLLLTVKAEANSCLSQSLAQRLANYRAHKTVFFRAVKKFEEKGTKKTFKALGKSLKENKISFQRGFVQIDALGPNPIPVLELTGSVKTPLNRYIQRSNKIFGNTRVFVADLPYGTSGMASPHENIIVLSRQVASDLKGPGRDTLAHEYRHVLYHRYKDAGMTSSYHGKFRVLRAQDDLPYLNRLGYNKFAEFSEVGTNAEELRSALRRFKQALRDSSSSLTTARSNASQSAYDARSMIEGIYENLNQAIKGPEKFMRTARLQHSQNGGIEVIISYEFVSPLGRKTPLKYTYPLPDIKQLTPQEANLEEAYKRINAQIYVAKMEALHAQRAVSFLETTSAISQKSLFNSNPSQLESLGLDNQFLINAFESAMGVGLRNPKKKTALRKALKKLNHQEFPPKEETTIFSRFFKEGTSESDQKGQVILSHPDMSFSLVFKPDGTFKGLNE